MANQTHRRACIAANSLPRSRIIVSGGWLLLCRCQLPLPACLSAHSCILLILSFLLHMCLLWMARLKFYHFVKQVQVFIVPKHPLSICSLHESGHAGPCLRRLWCTLLYWPTTYSLLLFLQRAVLHVELNSLTSPLPVPVLLPYSCQMMILIPYSYILDYLLLIEQYLTMFSYIPGYPCGTCLFLLPYVGSIWFVTYQLLERETCVTWFVVCISVILFWNN